MRPSADTYFLRMAKLVATRSTCLSRQVGCVIVDNRRHVVATGYNGPPAGFDHCTQCNRTSSGCGLDDCYAIHAEMNALLQCPDVYSISTIYCTDSPCIHCLKLLANTSCTRIVFLQEYPHGKSKEIWEKLGREWTKADGIVST